MGTSHRGSDQTSWASIASNLAKVLTKDHNHRIVQALSRGSKVDEGLRDSFAGIFDHLLIYIFFEEHNVSKIGKASKDLFKFYAAADRKLDRG